MDLEHKVLPLDLKAGNDRELAGYASTWGGEPDAYGDIVTKGAFAESLRSGRKVRLLWQHDVAEPIGKPLELLEDEKGLFGRWALADTDAARKGYALVKGDLIDGLSIGFQTKTADYNDDGVRVLRAVDLYEVSLVTIPANSNAAITEVRTDLPLDLLLKRTAEGLRVAAREAKALHERRATGGRTLNDRHIAALDELLAEAEATLTGLKALRVVAPDAEAERAGIELRLAFARRKYASLLTEQIA